MLILLSTFAFSMVGGWQPVDFDSEFVQNVMPYLQERYLKILPEFRNRDTLFSFQKASIQIVNVYIISITCGLGLTSYDFTIYVTPNQKKSLMFINMPQNALPQPGGWAFQSPEFEPENVNMAFNLLQTSKGLTSKMEKILMVRTQIVSGSNLHIVFIDSNQVIHSLIIYTSLNGQKSITFHETC